jgi:hypothetical protein
MTRKHGGARILAQIRIAPWWGGSHTGARRGPGDTLAGGSDTNACIDAAVSQVSLGPTGSFLQARPGSGSLRYPRAKSLE